MPCLVGAGSVLRELALDFRAKVDAGHLGQAGQVDEDVGKFFAEIGQAFAWLGSCDQGVRDPPRSG